MPFMPIPGKDLYCLDCFTSLKRDGLLSKRFLKAAPKTKADPKANIGSDSGNEEGSGELVTDDSTQTKLGKDSI